MNLTEWADAQGVHVATGYGWWREGALPVPARKAGRLILVSPGTAAGRSRQDAAGLSARVSCHDQKAGLGRRVARLPAWAAQAGLLVTRAGAEAGSGMAGTRAKARRLRAGPEVTVVVVEHRDRLGGMNTELAGAALAARGRRVAVGAGGVTDDLAGDMIEVLTWFCARLHGRRSAGNRALKAAGCARQDIGPLAVAGRREGAG